MRYLWLALGLALVGCQPRTADEVVRKCVTDCWATSIEDLKGTNSRDALAYAYAVCREICGVPFPPQAAAPQTPPPPSNK